MTTGVLYCRMEIDNTAEESTISDFVAHKLRDEIAGKVYPTISDGRQYVIEMRNNTEHEFVYNIHNIATLVVLRHADDCEIGEHCEQIPTGVNPSGDIRYHGKRWQFRKRYGFEFWERME